MKEKRTSHLPLMERKTKKVETRNRGELAERNGKAERGNGKNFAPGENRRKRILARNPVLCRSCSFGGGLSSQALRNFFFFVKRVGFFMGPTEEGKKEEAVF